MESLPLDQMCGRSWANIAYTNFKFRFEGVCFVECWPRIAELVHWLQHNSVYADLRGKARSLREDCGFAQAEVVINFAQALTKEKQRFWKMDVEVATKAASSAESGYRANSHLTFDHARRRERLNSHPEVRQCNNTPDWTSIPRRLRNSVCGSIIQETTRRRCCEQFVPG